MKAKRILLQITLTIVAAGFASAAAAAMYKWTDAEGNVQYSETAPEGANVKEIAPPPRISPPPASESAAKNGREGAEGEQSEEGQEAPLSPEEQEAYKRNCEAARSNLEIYKTSGRIKQSDGQVVEMNDEVRQKKIQQAEEQIKHFCK